MQLRPPAARTILAAGAIAALLSFGAIAANKASAASKLDNFLPAKIPGWLTDAPFDPEGMADHTSAVDQTYSSKDQDSGLTIQIQRIREDSRIGLPKLEKARLGQLPDGEGYASMLVLKGHNALLVYAADNKAGKVSMVAGRCVVIVEGSGVTQAQLVAAAGAMDLKGLDAACQ